MVSELDRIVSAQETLKSSINEELLKDLRAYPRADALSYDLHNPGQTQKIHILGSRTDPIMDGEFCSYRDQYAKEVLIVNPPDNYRITDLPTQNLTDLDIRFTTIRKLDLSHMPRLAKVNLANNPSLKSVAGLDKLTQLTSLDVHNTHLDDLNTLGVCTQLRVLDAGSLKLEDPRFLSELTALNELHLSWSQITRFPDLKNLSHLRKLDLSGADLPDIIESEFPASLQVVSLAHSSLRRLPDGFRTLQNLSCLDLSGMHLSSLPEWLVDLNLEFTKTKGDSGIILANTVIEGIDMHIFDHEQEVIRTWLRERREDDRLVPMDEVKVVFLGDGDAGKSSIIARLMKDGIPGDDSPVISTHGIAISSKQYILDNKDVTVHFWDFGGQEIFHSMHRMFLTERTVYVLVVNARDDTSQEQSLYWLRTLKSFTENCPVLLVLNKLDQNPNAAVDQWALRELYPELADVVCLSALCDSREHFCNKFTDVLLRLISEQPFLNTMLPASWKRLRRRIRSLYEHVISKEHFDVLCDDCGISTDPKVRNSLLSWFHDLGICFHPADSTIPSSHIVLRPDWISNALARILFSLYDEATNGMVPYNSILDCLCKSYSAYFSYSVSDVDYILSLMRKYRFSFQISDDREFIPSLCTRMASDVSYEYRQSSEVFRFRLSYAYQPVGLLHQLMAELKSALDIHNIWTLGAQFIWSQARALVMCEGDFLNIYVESGANRSKAQVCLTIIRDALERIHNDNHIQAGQLQVGYREGRSLEWFSYDALTAMARSGINHVYSPTLDKMIPVSDIWIYADHQAEIRRFVERISQICGDIQTNKFYWGATEDQLNTHLREIFMMQGYLVNNQMVDEKSEKPGELFDLDIRPASAPNVPWAVGGILNVRGIGKSERIQWDMQFEKLVTQSVKAAAPVVFTITFAACSIEDFPRIRQKYTQTFESFSPFEDQILPSETEVFSTSPTSYTVRCVYGQDGATVTAYHFLVRIGFDQVIEEKYKQRKEMPNTEYKVVFLGDGEAGKSLTVARLHEPEMNVKTFDGNVTPGIDIRSVPYEINGTTVQVNFWDFGGQEILHSMHRMFLSRRTLYVVLLNARNDGQDGQARFWLRYIDTYAPGAPVILVLNKIDQNEHAHLNEPVLRRQYPNIQKFLRISALTATEAEFKNDFVLPLKEYIQSITVQESAFSTNEIPIREVLRNWKNPRISRQEFEEVCLKYKIEDRVFQDALMKKLEDSGICVCFEGHSYSEQYRLLNPKWLTNAIYAILFNLHSQATNGIISHSTIHELFKKDPNELKCVQNIRYQPDEVDFVLQMMRFYRLSFEIPNQKQEFLPMLCPVKEVAELSQFMVEKTHLEFHMYFDYLPSEVLYQFMVARQHELELEKDSIWLTGALLRDEKGCRAAIVKEDNILKFHISRSHNLTHARSYMASLLHDMELIIQKNKLRKPETRVVFKYEDPINGNCIEELFDFDRLILSKDCGILNTVSKELNKSIAISDILDQTYHRETVLHDTLFWHLVHACQILQDNYDNYGKTEPVLNRYLRDLLRAMGYRISDQPESGASATKEGAGRPDLIVNFENSASNVLIEPLRITGCGKEDKKNWDDHLKKTVDNYNSSGYRMMVLVSYVTCSKRYFPEVDNFYYDRMCEGSSTGGFGKPEQCNRIQYDRIPDLIRITRAEYYTNGYSPTIYHFLVYIQKKSNRRTPNHRKNKPKLPS